MSDDASKSPPAKADDADTAWENDVSALFQKTLVLGSQMDGDERGEALLSERTRIAQELHDTLLQGFFAVSMQLHLVVDQLPENSAEKQRLSRVLQSMGRVLEEGRRAVQGLRVPSERTASLSQGLARVASDADFAPKVHVRVAVAGTETDLSQEVRDDVYRIGREAILNAGRHSGATEIEVAVEYSSTVLRVAVRDDGCGIDPQVIRRGRRGHWGLRGMRERAARIGAELHLSSQVGVGTEVELRVPGRIAYGEGEPPATAE